VGPKEIEKEICEGLPSTGAMQHQGIHEDGAGCMEQKALDSKERKRGTAGGPLSRLEGGGSCGIDQGRVRTEKRVNSGLEKRSDSASRESFTRSDTAETR